MEVESEVISRKRKAQASDNSNPSPEKKVKAFCCRTFRQGLKTSEALKSLKGFISAAKSCDDVVYEYMDNGGSLQEILSLIDKTATGDLTTALPVFEVVHLILLRFQSSDSKYHDKCIESARTILRSYLFIIKAMLSMNVAKQKKVALKVLTAIATLDSSFASEIINVAALFPTLINDLIQPSSEKESVRKCFVLFVLSFLIEGNINVVKNLMDKKGLLGSIIPGLKFDEATTVNLTLSLLEEKILKNVKIHKTLKLRVFNTQVIKSLFDLYDWKGLQGVKQLAPQKKGKVKEVLVDPSEKNVVLESLQSFLLLLCSSQKYGIAFHDKSLGSSELVNNQLLLTVFESLPDPLKNKKMSEVVLNTLVACTDLVKPVLLKLEPSFQPRNSQNWFQAIEFAKNLITKMNAGNLLKNETETPSRNQIIKVGKALCAPVVFLRVTKLGSGKQQPLEIRLRSLKLLTAIWSEIVKLFVIFKDFGDDLRKQMHKYLIKFLPDVEDLVELWHSLCKPENFTALRLSQLNPILILSDVLESFHIILECQSEAMCSPLRLASDLLGHVEALKENLSEREFDEIQVRIVRFLELDLPALIGDTVLFEKCLCILLRSSDETSLSFLSKILTSLGVFAGSEAEVDVWLSSYVSLPEEYRVSVAECLIQAFSATKEKTIVMDYRELSCGLTGETTSKSTEERLSPLLDTCVKTYQSISSELSKKNQKLSAFRHFLSDVTVHLQHFYTLNIYLYDSIKDSNKAISKYALNYLKNWKNYCLKPVEVKAFSCPIELELVRWILGEETQSVVIGDVVDLENTNLLKVYTLFRVVIAYLSYKAMKEDLLVGDVEKFVEVLSFFCHKFYCDRDTVDLISNDVKNKAVYQRNCLNCLFMNEFLLKEFDAFQKKESSSYHVTLIIFKVLMEKDVIKDLNVKKKLSNVWKCKFLKQLKTKLKKNKSIDGLNHFEKVLNFFQFEFEDVREIVKLFMSVEDLDLFVNGNSPSTWIVVLSKFIKMHCEKEELSEEVMKKLCLIMKHLNETCLDLEGMNDCFVYLLKKHPSHLLSIDNDFLKATLPSNKISCILKKLLLNDPNKVNCFLDFITNNLNTVEEPLTMFSLLSNLIISEDSFLNLNIHGESAVWKISEINPNNPVIYNALQVMYKKCEKNILQTLKGEKDETVMENLSFSRELVKLFLDVKKISKIKKDIPKGKFEPELLFEGIRKLNESEITQSFILGLLKLFSRVIKKSKNLEIDWGKYCSIVVDVLELNKDSSWEAIVDSTEWKDFAKLALGHCLSSIQHPPLMKIFRLMITAFYNPAEESQDCCLFFQMVISHSQFLKVILSGSPLKSELVELFYCLVVRSSSEMSSRHFPILLASYSASISTSDRTLLKILRLYEKKGIQTGDYEPFVWGETAVSHYSIGTSPGLSLWQRFNMGNVLDLLDTQKMELSLQEFPIKRSLMSAEESDYDSSVYDPAFLLPLFVNLLSPGSVVFCLSFIYKGGLAYTVRALSSEVKDIRLMAAIVLTRFYSHLESSQNLKQKLVWMHFINCLRYSIEDLATKPLPNISTLFLAKMTLGLSRQPAEMYLPLQNFLLAKPYFSFDTIPEFLPLFHSSEVSFWEHRKWLLEVIRDGTKTSNDINCIFHSMGLKVIFCFFYSQLCDTETKKLILQVLEKILRVDKAVLLISNYGLLDWVTSIDCFSFPSILHDLLNLLLTLTRVIIKDITVRKSKYSNSSHLVQILNLAVKLSPSLKQPKSVDDFKIYLKILNEICMLFVKEGKSDWFRLNRNELDEILDAGVVVLGGDLDCRKYSKVPFYFRDFEKESRCEELKKLVFLFNILLNDGNKNV